MRDRASYLRSNVFSAPDTGFVAVGHELRLGRQASPTGRAMNSSVSIRSLVGPSVSATSYGSTDIPLVPGLHRVDGKKEVGSASGPRQHAVGPTGNEDVRRPAPPGGSRRSVGLTTSRP